jgi:membrane protein
MFPFLIFLMSLMGFLNLDGARVMKAAIEKLPAEAYELVELFVEEVVGVRSPSLLSGSLLVFLYGASSGFEAVIKAINKAYDYEDCRGFIKTRLISVLMAFIFAAIVAGSEMAFILEGAPAFLAGAALLILMAALFYSLASCEKISIASTLPGATTAAFFWIASSYFFNLYMENFGKYSKVYGSIGGVFVLMLWINLMSFFLILGGEINAALHYGAKKNISV